MPNAVRLAVVGLAVLVWLLALALWLDWLTWLTWTVALGLPASGFALLAVVVRGYATGNDGGWDDDAGRLARVPVVRCARTMRRAPWPKG